MAAHTRIGFLDTQRCSSGEPLSALLAAPPPPVAFEEGAVLDRAGLEALMAVVYTPGLLFEREKDYRSMHLWAMPPPVSPADPFGGLASSSELGCSAQLHTGATLPQLCIRRVGVVHGVDCGLGLYATAPIPSGTFVCEYTGVVQCDPDPAARDDYAFGLPVCEPELNWKQSNHTTPEEGLFGHANTRERAGTREFRTDRQRQTEKRTAYKAADDQIGRLADRHTTTRPQTPPAHAPKPPPTDAPNG